MTELAGAVSQPSAVRRMTVHALRRRRWDAVALVFAAIAPIPIAGRPNVDPGAVRIGVFDDRFAPRTAHALLGQRVVWTAVASNHRTQQVGDNSGLGLFRSGALAPGTSFVRRFTAAGTYPVIDPRSRSLGVVRVPMRASPGAAEIGSTATLRWAIAPPPAGDLFSVEVEGPDSAGFHYLMRRGTSESATLPLTLGGQYRFAARVVRAAGGGATQWSPPASILATFATVAGAGGLAATAAGLYVASANCSASGRVMTVTPAGRARVLIPLAGAGNRCAPCSPAVSTGLGGFPAGKVFVACGRAIVDVGPRSGRVRRFASIPDAGTEVDGVTFDDVGRFHHDLIATLATGAVWLVSARGRARLLTRAPAPFQGPAVAPRTLGRYGGDLLGADPARSTIYAIDPRGRVAVAARWEGADFVSAVPPTLCRLRGTPYGLFVTDGAAHGVVAYPSATTAGLAGRLVVGSRSGAGIAVLQPTRSGLAARVLLPDPLDPRDASFVPCTRSA